MPWIELKNNRFSPFHPYHLLNIFLAFTIIIILIYSASYPVPTAQYPVTCIHMEVAGKPCPSCGITRSFTAAMHGNFDAARALNANGFKLFVFTVVQLLLRAVVSLVLMRSSINIKKTAIADAIVSAGLFLYVYYPFIKYQLSVFNQL